MKELFVVAEKLLANLKKVDTLAKYTALSANNLYPLIMVNSFTKIILIY